MNCEQLRIERNRAYVEYLNESDLTQKMVKLNIYHTLKAQYEDAYRQEVLGDYTITGFGTEGLREEDREVFISSQNR